MSESNVKEVTCRSCERKVPAGKFCSKCGHKIATESRDGATNEEPRRPIQASDAVSAYGTKVSSQQITDTSTLASASFSVTFNASTNGSCTYQGDEASTITAQLWSIADQAQHQQIQQSSSLGGVPDVTHVDNSSGRSGAQRITHGGAPKTPDREMDGNSWFEVWILGIATVYVNCRALWVRSPVLFVGALFKAVPGYSQYPAIRTAIRTAMQLSICTHAHSNIIHYV